jgi:hypothetical protein
MFQRAVIAPPKDANFSLGQLAEAMFFYADAQMVVRASTFASLVERIGPEDTLTLIRRGSLKVSLVQQLFGVRANTFVSVKLSASADRKVHSFEDELLIMLERSLGKKRLARRLSSKLVPHVTHYDFSDLPRGALSICDMAAEDASDPDYLRRAVERIARNTDPMFSLGRDEFFRIRDLSRGSKVVETNVDFSRINAHRAADAPLTPDTVLAAVINARFETFLSSRYMGDLITTPEYGDLIRIKHFEFLRPQSNSESSIKLFQDTTLANMPTIAEAIDTGRRTFSEFLALLDKADRFKGWIADKNPDQHLLNEYLKAATEKTWAEKLPSKSIRCVVGAGVGIAADALFPTGLGTLAGLGYGLADSLLLDKLIKGWRPSHFVEQNLVPFVKASPR